MPKTSRLLDRRWKKAGRNWSQEELDVLGDQYGLVPQEVLARRLGRSPDALKIAAQRKLHISRSMAFYTAGDVARELGVKCSKTVVAWLEKGWLEGSKSTVGSSVNLRWQFTEDQVVALLRSRPYLCDPKRMPQGYFRSVAREEYELDPWYTCAEVAGLLGFKTTDCIQRYIKKGWLPAVKRPGGPWQGVWVIRRSALQSFLANDPRPRKSEYVSRQRRLWLLSKGRPVRLAQHWHVRCPRCSQMIEVAAHPRMTGAEVQAVFAASMNGRCAHGGLVVLPGAEVAVCARL